MLSKLFLFFSLRPYPFVRILPFAGCVADPTKGWVPGRLPKGPSLPVTQPVEPKGTVPTVPLLTAPYWVGYATSEGSGTPLPVREEEADPLLGCVADRQD